MDDNNVSNVIPDLEEFQVDFDEVVNVGGGTSDFNQLTNRPKYDDQTMTGNTNIPKVPEKTSDLNNDSDYQTGTEVQEAIDDRISQIDIPTKTSDLTNDGADGTSTYVEADDLATVATTGSYSDLSNKPNIPTVNDATLTINQNGVTKGTFTANDSDNEICDLTDTTYTAGTNVQISAQNEISATDTTYSDFTGTDGTAAGASGLVPAPATTDAGKFLKADGTWDTAGGGGVTPVQTTGTSTTDVMSQDATTKMIYPDIANNPHQILIGGGWISGTNKCVAINGTIAPGINGGSVAIGAPDGNFASIGSNGRANGSIAIGNTASAGRGMYSVAIGYNSYTSSGQDTGDNVAIGSSAYAGNNSATSTVALGAYAKTTRTGEVNIGAGTSGAGYNSTNYRVLGGVHDGQLAQDAATVAQVNATIDAINAALSTNIPHIGAAS